LKNIEDICVIVQGRLGSQRVPKKMLRAFCDTTLTDICLDKIKACKSFPQSSFFFSAWEPELKKVCDKHGAQVFYRSEKSAKSEGTPMTEMYEWWDKLPFKYCVLVNACAPFLKPATIDNFVTEYLKSDADGMFGVIEKKNYFWNSQHQIITPLTEAVMNTKTVETTYEAAHSLYAGRLDKIGRGIWMGDFNEPGDIELFPMAEQEVFDIDYEWQFLLGEKMWESKNE